MSTTKYEFKGTAIIEHRIGRPATGIKSANNFNSKILRAFDIEHERVIGHPWFYITMPTRQLIRDKLVPYKKYSLEELSISKPPFTHIITLEEPQPQKEDLLTELAKAKLRRQREYNSQYCPTWWSHAQRWLTKRDIPYTIRDRTIATISQLYKRNGMTYDNSESTALGYVLVKLPLSTSEELKVPYVIENDALFAAFRIQGGGMQVQSETFVKIDKHRQYTFQFITWAAYKGELERMKKAVQHYINHDYGRVDIVVSDDDIKSLQQLITQEPKWFPEEQDCTESTEECLQLFIEHWNPSTEAKND